MFEPFLEAATVIKIHALSGILSLALGPVALYGRKRGGNHKVYGYIWVVAMALVAVTAFFIHSFAVIGPFSPLHLFAICNLATLWYAINKVRSGDIIAHKAALRSLYWYGLIFASFANFLPERMVNRTFFQNAPDLGFVVIGTGLTLLVLSILRQRFTRQRMTSIA